MTTQPLTLTLPEPVLQHLQEIAAATQQSLEQLVRQSIEGNLPPSVANAPPEMQRELPKMPPLVVQMRPVVDMTDDEFFMFCQINRDLRIERTIRGEIIIMAPAGGETGSRNASLTIRLGTWAEQDDTGTSFDSSTGFILPNGATRAPDAAWVRRSRLATLTPEQKRKFLPLCPDFVVELRSPSDRLEDVQAKMQEYRANGAQLGWLIDPEERQVFVYQPDAPVTHLPDPTTLAGDPVLPGFVLNLADIWDPGF